MFDTNRALPLKSGLGVLLQLLNFNTAGGGSGALPPPPQSLTSEIGVQTRAYSEPITNRDRSHIRSMALFDVPVPPSQESDAFSPKASNRFYDDLMNWSVKHAQAVETLRNFIEDVGSVKIDFYCALNERTMRYIRSEEGVDGIRTRAKILRAGLADLFDQDAKRMKEGASEYTYLDEGQSEMCAIRVYADRVRPMYEAAEDLYR